MACLWKDHAFKNTFQQRRATKLPLGKVHMTQIQCFNTWSDMYGTMCHLHSGAAVFNGVLEL